MKLPLDYLRTRNGFVIIRATDNHKEEIRKMDFDFSNAFEGKRLTKMTRASVQKNGRLNFPPEAARQMGLTLEQSLLICPMGQKDLAVTLVEKDDPRGFTLKKTGPYFYVPFKSLMNECGIDFVNQTVVYDIIELNEKHEGKPVFKFNRRIITHDVAAEPVADEVTATEVTAQ